MKTNQYEQSECINGEIMKDEFHEKKTVSIDESKMI